MKFVRGKLDDFPRIEFVCPHCQQKATVFIPNSVRMKKIYSVICEKRYLDGMNHVVHTGESFLSGKAFKLDIRTPLETLADRVNNEKSLY